MREGEYPLRALLLRRVYNSLSLKPLPKWPLRRANPSAVSTGDRSGGAAKSPHRGHAASGVPPEYDGPDS